MKRRTRERFETELRRRGYSEELQSPNDGMGFAGAYLDEVGVAELLDSLVVRREKIDKSVEVVGKEVAKRNYDDVVKTIDALKAVIGAMTLPGEDT